jgi:diguanylate cyclase (GGDEF)-like protein
VKFERGEAPAAGFEKSDNLAAPRDQIDFLVSINAARQEFQSLLKLTEELGHSIGVDETLSLVAARLKRTIPHDTIAIYVTENQRLVPKFVSGEDSRFFSGLCIPVGQGLSGWVVENQVPIINGNPSVEPSYLNDPTLATHLRSALSVPLEARGQVFGALSIYCAAPDFFTKDHLRILLAICSKAGMALANAIQHQRVATSAATDDLTGLPNSRSLFVHLQLELAHAARENSSVVVVVVDLDGFKKINDDFGHLEGNRVLQRVGEGLRAICRGNDYVSRLGGDEFVLIISGMTRDHVAHKLIQMHEVIAKAADGPRKLAASAGVATYPEDGLEAEALLDIADKRMYAEKNEHHGLPPVQSDVEQTLVEVY